MVTALSVLSAHHRCGIQCACVRAKPTKSHKKLAQNSLHSMSTVDVDKPYAYREQIAAQLQVKQKHFGEMMRREEARDE